MILSVLLPSFNADFAASLRAAAELGFTHVDVVALASRPEADLEGLADSGLTVCCAAVGRGLPEGQTLDAASLDARRAALEIMQRQLDDAALLGASTAYIVPGLDASEAGLLRFTDACRLLADHAVRRKIRLCVEHVPGRALAEASRVLDWFDEAAHSNLHLLLDVGHCLITREDPATLIRQVGEDLGYVHFDDNDGVGDLHLPLLAGRLTEAGLDAVIAALRAVKYEGGLCLELNPQNPQPCDGVREGKALLEKLCGT